MNMIITAQGQIGKQVSAETTSIGALRTYSTDVIAVRSCDWLNSGQYVPAEQSQRFFVILNVTAILIAVSANNLTWPVFPPRHHSVNV